ncbi:ferrous iron transport protein B [Prolixibacteraceae bacterium JC049]|nr:ferrous iron transport protein B [Prolixibacteraceae bacterium JC049]
MRLSEINTDQTVIITKVLGHGSFRKRISEMGFVKGKEVYVVKNAPFKDPVEYRIMDYNVSLRRSEASLIEVITQEEALQIQPSHFEGVIDDEILKTSAKEKGRKINVALVGNPNCGKTSLFNFASGSKEHVGNYSGVTVDAKKAQFKQNDYSFNITDLPGTYSLTAYTPEELFVRKFIMEETPDIVINVIDASNIERNLYLTTQLIDMDIKVVIALNMYDELENSGSDFRYKELAKMIGVPIIPTICSKGKGIEELFNKVIDVYEDRDPIVRHIHINYGTEVEKSIKRIREVIKQAKPIIDKASSRFLALKLLEKDEEVARLMDDYRNASQIRSTTKREIKRIEKHSQNDSETIITDAKYGFITGALKETYKAGNNYKGMKSGKIDSILTNKYLAIPLFLLFMFTTFYSTFTLGQYPMDWIEMGVTAIADWVNATMAEGMFKDLIVDGIISGTGSVLVFVPNIVILFFFISLMEDTGYMARAAFIMDKFMHRFGLHGRSFIPLIMGFGCNVPAIMATRTLRNKNDRLLTMLITPFMSCSARLPVYVLFISAFFPEHRALYLFGLYFTGIILALLLAQLLNLTVFKSKASPFVMELPPYRVPTFRNILIHMWDKASQYLRKIASVILIAVVIIWALGYFPRHTEKNDQVLAQIEQLEVQQQKTPDNTALSNQLNELQHQAERVRLEDSYLGRIGKTITPVMAPLGFDWKMSVSLLTGTAAKEIVVSTIGVLYQADDADGETANLQEKLRSETYKSGKHKGKPVFTTATALAFLIFVLIYFPCVGVVATIRKESGKTFWALFTVIYTTVLAWVISFIVYHVTNWII